MPIKRRRYAVLDQDACVACGCCKAVCPKGAITIYKGIYAQVARNLCVGCGMCVGACPASILSLVEEEV